MNTDQTVPKTIDDYIAGFSDDLQEILQKIRMTIREAAPDAEETISYQMPAFKLKGILVYFAAFKKHIGLFPPVTGDEKLMSEASVYAGPKGNLRFPLDQTHSLRLDQRDCESQSQGKPGESRGQREEVIVAYLGTLRADASPRVRPNGWSGESSRSS